MYTYTPLQSPIRATCPADIIFLECITPTICIMVSGTDYKAPHYVVISTPIPRLLRQMHRRFCIVHIGTKWRTVILFPRLVH
jgi:hypothetical protein